MKSTFLGWNGVEYLSYTLTVMSVKQTGAPSKGHRVNE